jgi:hypothetical protein
MNRRNFLLKSNLFAAGVLFYPSCDGINIKSSNLSSSSRPDLISEPVFFIESKNEMSEIDGYKYALLWAGNEEDGLYQREESDWKLLKTTSINLDWIKGDDLPEQKVKRIIEINHSEKKPEYAVYFPEGEFEFADVIHCDDQYFWGVGTIIPKPGQNDRTLRINGNGNIVSGLSFFEKTFCRGLLELDGNDNLVENCKFYKANKSTSNRVIYSDRFLYIRNPQGQRNQVRRCEFVNGRIGASLEGNYKILDCSVSHCITGLLLRPSSNGSEIAFNHIFENDVNHHSGADGILAQRNVTNLHIHHNDITKSGEHGIYFQGDSSLIENNNVSENHRSGIKLASYTSNLFEHPKMQRDPYLGFNNVIRKNICIGNSKDEKDTTNAGIYLQAPLENIRVEENDCSDNNYGIRSTSLANLRTEELESRARLRDLYIINNIAHNTRRASLYIEGERDVYIEKNRVDSLLTDAKTSSHRLVGAVIKNNEIKGELTLNRAQEAEISNNKIGRINIISNSQNRNHRIRNNN